MHHFFLYMAIYETTLKRVFKPVEHISLNTPKKAFNFDFMKKTEIFQHIFSTCFQSHRTSRKQSRDKKPFLSPSKKVTFSLCRILNAKTKKSEVFLKHFSILILYGENQHSQKLPFYHLYLQLTLTFCIENIASVYYCDFENFNFVHFQHATDYQISMFWSHNFTTEKSLLRPKNIHFWPKLRWIIFFASISFKNANISVRTWWLKSGKWHYCNSHKL